MLPAKNSYEVIIVTVKWVLRSRIKVLFKKQKNCFCKNSVKISLCDTEVFSFNVSFIPFCVYGFWSLLSMKLSKYENFT